MEGKYGMVGVKKGMNEAYSPIDYKLSSLLTTLHQGSRNDHKYQPRQQEV